MPENEPKLRENRGNAGKGRPKGSKNRATRAIRQAVQIAFDEAGGVDYLVKLSKDDPRTFCGLVAKVIPLQVEGTGADGSILFKTVYEGK